jgi:hypothetical protein
LDFTFKIFFHYFLIDFEQEVSACSGTQQLRLLEAVFLIGETHLK